MLLRSPARLSAGLWLGLALLYPPLARAASEKVRFDTVDGVKLEGTFWASAKGKSAPTVLLLHNFEAGKGGNSHEDGWDRLGDELQAKEYNVLSFDFRGHGKSTTLDEKVFWSQPHHRVGGNFKGLPIKNPLPTSFSHTNFLPRYYPYLVNDIAAAKAFLDTKHDAGEVNTSNLIVIGAGEGATLGAMWLASECHRCKVLRILGVNLYELDKPESSSVVAAIWLTPSPSLAKVSQRLGNWILEAASAKGAKIPTLFVYGEKDEKAKAQSLAILKSIIPGYERGKTTKDDKDFEFTGEKVINGTETATGSKLLDKELKTVDFLIKDYLFKLMEKHTVSAWKARDFNKNLYVWKYGLRTIVAKDSGSDLFKLVPAQ